MGHLMGHLCLDKPFICQQPRGNAVREHCQLFTGEKDRIMRYEQVGSTYFGHGIIKDGAFKMTVSEVLNDNESVLTVIFEAGPQAAMVKTSKCERVQ